MRTALHKAVSQGIVPDRTVKGLATPEPNEDAAEKRRVFKLKGKTNQRERVSKLKIIGKLIEKESKSLKKSTKIIENR